MADVRIFPFSRSRAFLDKAAIALADEANPDAWPAMGTEIATKMFDRGVTDSRIDIELCALRDRAARIAAQRAAAPARKAQRQLRLVPPPQLDLFGSSSADGEYEFAVHVAEAER